ncbi:hypothetical protein FGRMN_6542 [Fusarium graminum]|nr:hypothetical protein FGRMN_6542 [Fusarium graminum]
MELCGTCQAFNIQAFDAETYAIRGYKLLSAINAAESGCPFCSLLVKARFPQGRRQGMGAFLHYLTDWIYIQADQDWKRRLESQCSHNDNDNSSHNSAVSSPLGLTRLWAIRTPRPHAPRLGLFQVLADEGSPAAINGDVMGRLLDAETGSNGHVQMLSFWLQQCQEGHEECRLSLSGSPLLNPEVTDLPNRCIEVSLNSDGKRTLKLRETGGRRGKYITLTHRWIQPDTVNASTIRGNYSDRLRGKTLNGLPRHFEDAFYLASQMGIPFVWIDSLCIVQDDEQDWTIEAARMAKYYQNSFFTIAGFGVTRETGLFAAPDQHTPLDLVQLPYRDREGNHKGYFYVRQVNQPDTKEQYVKEIAQSDLLSRGWIFQEWILSRRVICYTRTACFYQCQKFNPRTTASNDVDLASLEDGDAGLSLKNLFRLDFSKSNKSIFDKWRFAVHTYSSLRLTKAGEDRLTALAGISEEFSIAINRSVDPELRWHSIYLSGMWAGDIIISLLWEMDGVSSSRRLSGIPTWSWASVTNPVIWQKDHRRVPPWGGWSTKEIGKFLGPKKASVDEQLSVSENDLTIDADLDGPVTPSNQFVTPQFNTLVMQGKLLNVRVDGLFDSDSDLDIAAILSGYEIDPEHNLQTGFTTVPGTRTREYWRKISLSRFPDDLCGWASIDDLVTSSEPLLLDVLAFPLTKTTMDYPQFGLGHFWTPHQAYSIILLRRIADGSPCFERIGVGRIFGVETVDELKLAEEARFWMV